MEFLKPVDSTEVVNCLCYSDILVLPSVFEGYGIAILEAMSLGVVPAVYRLPLGITNELDNSNSIISDTTNIKDLTQLLIETIEDPIKLRNLKVNARNFVKSGFDIKVTSEQYFEYFEDALELIPSIEKFNGYQKTSILDTKLAPNFLVKLIRKIKYVINDLKLKSICIVYKENYNIIENNVSNYKRY